MPFDRRWSSGMSFRTSGKKYKRCCLPRDEAVASAPADGGRQRDLDVDPDFKRDLLRYAFLPAALPGLLR